MSGVAERNFAAIEQALNTMNKQMSAFNERVTRMENTVTILQAEMTNQKQVTAHVLGRGMGSTVG